jgi:SMI1 / KNR4 family (SUKH-1)
MNPITVQIQRLKEKLEIARNLDRQSASKYLKEDDYANFHRFFGADRHNFNLYPTLNVDRIDEWEAKYKTKLPLEYRSFLMEIGNGGAGPYHGMLSLADVDRGWSSSSESIPSQPCLLLEKYQDDDLWEQEIAGEDWETKYDNEEWLPEFGTLTICEYGCGGYFYLVLNGALTGRVFFLEWNGMSPKFLPMANFLDWYESWLNLVVTGDMKHYWG